MLSSSTQTTKLSEAIEEGLYPAVSWHMDPVIKPKPGTVEDYALMPASPEDIKKVVASYQGSPVPGYHIKSVQVIYNPTLNHAFYLEMKSLNKRHANPAFHPAWRAEAGKSGEWREKSHSILEVMAAPHQDPSCPRVTLVPMWHGTKQELLPSILSTGFSNLATTDSGFFGKGIYAAGEAKYSWTVYGKSKKNPNPALLMNWVASYSAYPVIDGDMGKLETKGNFANYDAHFIPVRPDDPNKPNTKIFYPCAPGQPYTYTEMVVFNPRQCLARYVVELQEDLLPNPSSIFSAAATVETMSVPEAMIAELSLSAAIPFPSPSSSLIVDHPAFIESGMSSDMIITESFNSKKASCAAVDSLAVVAALSIPVVFSSKTDGEQALRSAVEKNDYLMVNALLGAGIHPDADSVQNTPLFKSIKHSKDDQIFYQLIQAGANIFAKTNQGHTVIECIGIACAWPTAMKQKAFDFLRKKNLTLPKPLQAACVGDETMLSAEIVSDVSQTRDSAQNTPVHYAVANGQMRFCRILCAQHPRLLTQQNSLGNTALLLAAYDGHVSSMQWLLEQGSSLLEKNNEGMSPILCAAWNGHLPAIEWLIARGATISEKDKFGKTPLLCAAWNGHIAAIELLLTFGATLAEQDQLGTTALMRAVRHHHFVLMEWLLRRGASVSQKSYDGMTAMLWTAKIGNIEAAESLLAHGSSLTEKDNNGKSVIDLASGEAIKSFLQHYRSSDPTQPGIIIKNAPHALFFQPAVDVAACSTTRSVEEHHNVHAGAPSLHNHLG